MENTSRKRNGSRLGGDGCGAKRPLGPAQRELCKRNVACEGEDGHHSNELIKAVLDDFATSEGRAASRDRLTDQLGGKAPADVKIACLEILGRVDNILSAKAPGDSAAFKNWLRQISQNVAEASSEGGFLGFGGVVVSDSEKATVSEISRVLKLD